MSTSAAIASETLPEHAPAGAPAKHGGIELLWPLDDQSEAAGMMRRGVLLCKAGQAVARPVAPAPNARANPAASTLRLGPGVSWDAVKSVYIACRNGHARLVQDKLDVFETLDWSGNLDAAHGPFRFDGDIMIRRGVMDLVTLQGSRDITVQDCIEAADVQAGRDITVQRGICGKEKGSVRAGGRLVARFLSNARILAGGDVVIENEIDNSFVRCGGELRVDRGTIMAGHVNAASGIRCHTAGSPSGVKTILELGVSAEQQAEISLVSDAIAVKRQKAAEIRTLVEPLMARQRTLTAAQKEKATELLFLADQFDVEAQELANRLAILTRPMDAAKQGSMRIASALHPGVILKFPNQQACPVDCLRGPLTVKLLVRGAEHMIVAMDDFRGTPMKLQPLE